MTRCCLPALCLLAGMLLPPTAVAQGDPTSKAECLRMTRGPLEEQCRTVFAQPGQAAQRDDCLGRIGAELDAVCEQFFGEGRDFCATCTSSCTQSFPAGDGRRRECLAMCLRQSGCQ